MGGSDCARRVRSKGHSVRPKINNGGLADEMLRSVRLVGCEDKIFEPLLNPTVPFDVGLLDALVRSQAANDRRIAQAMEQLETFQKKRSEYPEMQTTDENNSTAERDDSPVETCETNPSESTTNG